MGLTAQSAPDNWELTESDDENHFINYIMYLVYNGNYDLIKQLCQGDDIFQDDDMKNTLKSITINSGNLLHFAVTRENPKFIQILVENCGFDIEQVSYLGKTPMQLALISKNKDVIGIVTRLRRFVCKNLTVIIE
jgi:ankyrin repeat protein